MYGNGNSINPIWKTNGQFLVWGDRTMQRAESKLSAIHSVNLVNWIVNGLSDLGRQFVFDPNDKELLLHIQLAFSEFLDKIQNERGLEQYELVVDERNNTAETRNQRSVIVDLAVIPVDVMERLYLNVTVRESGAILNSVT
jgi:phage tail sheath protein FI